MNEGKKEKEISNGVMYRVNDVCNVLKAVRSSLDEGKLTYLNTLRGKIALPTIQRLAWFLAAEVVDVARLDGLLVFDG